MMIWDALRRFSGNGRRRPTERSFGPVRKRQGELGSFRGRDLRMEQFEARMLLSISATSLEDISTYLSPNVVRAVERVSDLDAYTPEELALTRQWVVGVSDPTTASQMAAAAGADYLGASNVLRKASVWNFSADTSWETAVDLLEATEGIDYFYPLVPHTADLCLVPNDPLFPEQWHLENTGQDGGTPGLDAHVVPAWDSVLGTGVVIGVVDTGLQYNHPDLLAQYRADLSYDFIDHDPDPSPRTFDENHGTAVAGVSAAAGDNAVGVSGAAPGAEIAGLRLIGGYFTDFDCASALSYQNQEIDIYNNSWGPSASFFNWPRTEGPMSLAALEDGVTNGRDGLGNIYLFAAGNSRVEGSDANLFDLSNSRYAIAVAGIDSTGHYASYSNPGACLLISGYTDNIVTTDRTGEDGYNSTGTFDGDPLPDTNYTSTFNGTSAATPLVSGVIALILEANPSLTYRDVQYILVNSAEKNDAYDSDWTVNAAGYHVNHNYGFGAIDAEAAVQLAYGWENVSEEVTTGSDQIQINQTIPDGSTSGLTSSVTLDDTVTDIEWVEVTVDIAHSSPADLEVILTSPDGTKSRLANASSQGFYFSTTGYSNWTFTTCRDWGESSEGTWTLEVRDRFGGTVGSWNSWELNVYGQHIEDIPEPPEPGVEGIGPELVAIVPNAGSTIQNGAVLHISPRELMLQFNEGQEIDADTLGAIRIIRAGGDDVLGNANDEVVDFGWIGIGDRPNEVIIRFAETLPDDLYQITIVGAGDAPLTNIDGDVFHEGKDLNIRVTLDLGAQVIAVVPQPTYRNASGHLQQSRNTIEVYFNDDQLDETTAENPLFYRLSVTFETATPADNVLVNPTAVTYDPVNNKATLTFANDLATYGIGAFRLRIGNEYHEIATSTVGAVMVGDTFDSAEIVGQLGNAIEGQSVIVTSTIEPQPYDLAWPGSEDEPGHRDLPDPRSSESHYLASAATNYGADVEYGAATIYYNFKDLYGYSPSGAPLYNLITETQKQRAREVFELYGTYLGVQFIEDPRANPQGLTIVTGDMRAVNPNIPTGPGGAAGIASGGIAGGIAIMDNGEAWGNSEFGGGWFRTAMHEIGHLLGLGHAYDLPGETVMGQGENSEYIPSSSAPLDDDSEYYDAASEGVYPGNADIVHGQYLFRPDSNDVDVYQFTLIATGTLNAETVAERMDNSSLLDSVITLYDAAGNLVARNDDYYSEDSYVSVQLSPGTYYVAVSSTGNTAFDPNVVGSGLGGTSQGDYDLRLTFLPSRLDDGTGDAEHMLDTTGTMLDGDADGVPGGVYSFWFNVQTEAHTIFVDKSTTGGVGRLGSLARPYSDIDDALAAARPGDVVRIVGNRDRTFLEQETFEVGVAPQQTAVGDLDGDGAADLVVTNQDDGTVSVLYGLGDGTFWAPVTLDVGNDPVGLQLADTNGDGRLDIVVANRTDGTISLLRNRGNRSFATQTTRFAGSHPTALALGDLNNDGTPDIVVVNEGDNTVGVLLSMPLGAYADQVAYAVGDTPVGVALGDLNNDGYLDIVAVNNGDENISVLLNKKKGTFGVQTLIGVGGEPTAVEIADLDGDGANDIVVANGDDDTISVRMGVGNGTFPTEDTYDTGTEPFDLAIVDLDGDGALDVVTANRHGDNVSLLFGIRGGAAGARFEESVEYEVGDKPIGLAVGDVDGDDRADIVTANNGDDTLSVLLARRDQAYEIGVDIANRALDDGSRMEVPRGVTVMIDAGAVFKLRQANIDVGSSSVGLDRSLGALQVLGTPTLGVCFTSFHDQTIGERHGPSDFDALGGDWGGLVFRNDVDYDEARTVLETEGIFLDYVNHAEIRYGGGQVRVNSVRGVYNPIHMVEARPTISFNTVVNSASAAISADPNSFADTKFQDEEFTAGYDRVGPDIHGNVLLDNSINGLFVRIRTEAGKPVDELSVCGRFNDMDIVHVISENLFISGTPGGPTLGTEGLDARLDARLTIDPGIIVKLDHSRIEVEVSAQLIAEGRSGYPVIFTSLFDDRYGAGGTFDTTGDGDNTAPAPGDWGGIYFHPTSTGSIDNAFIAHAGGSTRIEGGFAQFNPIEIHQAKVRLTNSILEDNTGGTVGDRNGRGTAVDSTIFIRGAQPIIAGNIIRDNTSPAISIDANSLAATSVADWGRSTGLAAVFDAYPDNHGPLVRENHLANNEMNGLLVRGETLTTDSVWDDTDIVHVLLNEIVVPNFHTYGGLRLQSGTSESLVVKLLGDNAGFTALGTPQEIDDRIGGTLQIVGMPGYPVILTSLADDTVGAGVDPWGQLQRNTDNAANEAAAGDWRSVKLEEYVNDRNVAIILENEGAHGVDEDANDDPLRAQYIGQLATGEQAGDDNIRLGFDVQGFLRDDDPAEVDVYAFAGRGGTEVWLDIDRTSLGLDSIVELIDADGNVFARSDDSPAEAANVTQPYGIGRTMDRDVYDINDMYTTNPKDAGMRLILPGSEGELRTYYVRVRSVDGASAGAYQLQIRLGETQEFSGSTVQLSSIRYATSGIELLGLPTNSPLLIDTTEVDLPGVASFASMGIGIPGDKNDFGIIAKIASDEYNGVSLVLVDGSTTGNTAVATYDAGAKTLTVDINPGVTTTQTIIAAINAEGTFNAVLLASEPNNDGSGVVNVTGTASATAGGNKGGNNVFAGAEDIGNLLGSASGTLGVSGYLDGVNDIDWYSFTIDTQKIQEIPGVQPDGIAWPAIFDIDYADGMARPDVAIYVFDSTGKLVYMADDSSVADDQPVAADGSSVYDLTRGSFGVNDPLLGPVLLNESNGQRYYVAVTSKGQVPVALDEVLARTEPVDSIVRIAEDHVDGGSLFPDTEPTELNVNIDDYHLNDVVLYVTDGADVYTINPFTGEFETDLTGPNHVLADVDAWGAYYGDLVMRDDGRLYSMTAGAADPSDALLGQFREFSTADGTLVYSQDDGIATYQVDMPDNPTSVVLQDCGVRFYAYAFVPDDPLQRFFAVGQRDAGYGVSSYTNNLLYYFNADGTVINPISDTSERLPTVAIPWGQLLVARYLGAVASEGSSKGNIADGMKFSINVTDNVTFEFDCGYDVRLTRPVSTVNDGDKFTVNGQTFEFNTGPTLTIDDYTLLRDGDTLQISNGTDTVTFEIDLAGDGVAAGNVAVDFTGVGDNDAAATRLRYAINHALFGVTATGTGAQVILAGDQSLVMGLSGGVSTKGDYVVAPGNVAVNFEQDMTVGELMQAMVDTLSDAGIEAYSSEYFDGATNSDAGRMTLPDATSANFSGTAALRMMPGSPGVTAGNYAVPFHAGQTADVVAQAMTDAISQANADGKTPATASRTNAAVVLGKLTGDTTITTAGTPLTLAGGSKGAPITGLAFSGGSLYAVDYDGGLYMVGGYESPGFQALDEDEQPPSIKRVELGGPFMTLVNFVDGIKFLGLSAGPQHLEEGAYADILFATDDGGALYALNTSGKQQPVFFNGASSIDTGLGALSGLAFSTLDYNLWHIASNRENDEGHGINIAPDNTRIPQNYFPVPGGTSFWFGLDSDVHDVDPDLEAVGTYDLPGGAYGTLTTDPFSLADYGPDTNPVVTFTYFLETDGVTSNAVTDSARVFVSSDGATWTLVASNIDTAAGFMVDDQHDPTQPGYVVPLADGTGQWHQATVDLSAWANMDNLRLKFEFSTAGGMQTGIDDMDPAFEGYNYNGTYLRSVAGRELLDGDTFVLADPVTGEETTFEFDKGFSLLAPNSAGMMIPDGATLTINGVVFEFDKDNVLTSGGIPILISDADPSGQVAERIGAAVAEAVEAGLLVGVRVLVVDDRVFLDRATTLLDSSGEFTIEGDGYGIGTDPTHVLVTIRSVLDAASVAKAIGEAMDSAYCEEDPNPDFYTSVKVDQDLLHLMYYRVVDPGKLTNYPFSQPGDERGAGLPDTMGTHYGTNTRGTDNAHEGFYVDDLIIGFKEHGQMLTGTEFFSTDFRAVDPGTAITEGYYQLEIRTATQYGVTSTMMFPVVGLTRIFDTNDRQTDGITILAPAGYEIVQGETFTVNDGVNTQTFQFIDASLPNATPLEGCIVIHFEQGQTAERTAALVAAAINGAATIETSASSPGGSTAYSNRVDLFGAASVTGASLLVFDNEGQDPVGIEAIDLTGDGLAEIITANESNGTISVLLQLDIPFPIFPWRFAAPVTFEVGTNPSAVRGADVNGDGMMDLVVSNAGDHTVSVLLGNNDATFETQRVFSVGRTPDDVALADLDGDGNIDIVTANKTDNTVSVLYGNGDGTFDDAVAFAVGLAPMGVALGDLDGNGVADVVTANSGDNSVSVLLGNVGGGYADAVHYAVGRLPVAVALGDLDSTGSLDIVTANRVDGTASVLLGTGDGTFGEQRVFVAGDSPVDVELADVGLGNVYADGNLDVVLANYETGAVTALFGTGSADTLLRAPRTVSVGSGTNSVAFADVLGLGYISIIVANYFSDSVTVPYEGSLGTSPDYREDVEGDTNLERAQGQVIVSSNEILYSAEYGINFDAGQRDSWSHPGAAAPLREVNTERLVPCVTIENNLIVGSGTAGILFSGDPNTSGADAAVPYGRIINNTIYGGVSSGSWNPGGNFPDAPVEVTSTTTNANALRDYIVGTGIQTVGNATFVGGNTSAGFFEAGSWKGIVLTTGDATNAEGPNVSDGDSGIASGVGDPDLDAEFGTTTTDTTYLEFQFITTTGDLHFSYVFASEEYNEFVNSMFNDVFAFFLDGENVALIPETVTPVSINTVNGGNPLGVGASHPQYYNNNDLDDDGEFLAEIGYDGFTTIFTAEKLGLAPGVHTIKLAISDVGDLSLDSGVFIQAGSFSNTVPLGTGIRVEQNASPTILNNIISTTGVGIDVDGTSTSTVIGANLYQDNTSDVAGIALGLHDIVLGDDDPLFVNAATGNFYLAAGSRAIDSSIDSLADRPAMTTVRGALGMPESPILAPETDLYGQLRSDDPSAQTPPGFGSDVFKDRGAIDRVDFLVPMAKLIDPLDNDMAGDDLDPAENSVFIADERLFHFAIQLTDTDGSGIDDSTVVAWKVQVFQEGKSTALESGKDYFFSYDVNTDVITLTPAVGAWDDATVYTVKVDNGAGGICDIAGNRLRSNRVDGSTTFVIAISYFDYGDAPDPEYATLWENNGARHPLIGKYYLGQGVTGEKDANLSLDRDGNQLPDANGDLMDDGVVFQSGLLIGAQTAITVTASQSKGYLDAWVDFNLDGVWSPDEQIFDSLKLSKGKNTLTFTTPAGLDPAATYARFRYSSTGGLEPTGQAADGEVEDYRVYLISSLQDFGDAPDSYSTTLMNDGARHDLGSGLFLGSLVDHELDGQPDPAAMGDDLSGQIDPVSKKVLDDEDGVALIDPAVPTQTVDWLVPGTVASASVFASQAGGYLNAWIDFNRDGVWSADEKVADGLALDAGENIVSIDVPEDATLGKTFARFRLSTTQSLDPTGVASDGEVEDYQFLVSSQPRDYGDAPRSYATAAEPEPAMALVSMPGGDNDILLTANTAGTEFNGISIVFVNNKALRDNAYVTFNALAGNLVIDVDPMATTANTVVAAINAEGTFTAVLDTTVDVDNDGTGLMGAHGRLATTAGGVDGSGTDTCSHMLGSHLYLGSLIDVELDGQPDPHALGDDNHGLDDEDGILLPNKFIAGHDAQITVTVHMGSASHAYLNAWFDLDGDGEWTDDEQVIAALPVVDGEQTVTVHLPIDAEAGTTFARFRLSSQADLSYLGTAPDGEVEDYEIQITKGNGVISGWEFNDLDNDGVRDTKDVGLAGVTVFIDANNNGILDVDAQGQPTEPVAVTMQDDLSTAGVNETGYYEFTGLLAQPEAYVIREIVPNDWIQTYPNASIVLPDGSHGNNDGSYSVFVSEGEVVPNVTFGNYKRPHITVESIEKVTVVEGNAGYTEVKVNLLLTESFGAPVAVSYYTSDGTAKLANNDYVAATGSVVINPQNAPPATWKKTMLTSNSTNDYDYQVSGKYVVWEGWDGHDWEIFLFDGTFLSGGEPHVIQLTNNDTDDNFADVFDTGSGVNVVWVGKDLDPTQDDTEVFLYDGGVTQQITHNGFDDRDPRTSDSHVTWWGNDGTDSEIYLYDIEVGGAPINLSDNTTDDLNPIISGENVVWTGYRSVGTTSETDLEIYVYDGTKKLDGSPNVVRVTSNHRYDGQPQIDGNNVVWEAKVGATDEILLYQIDTKATTQITTNIVDDRYPQVSGDDIVWEGYAGTNWEIMHYNTEAQGAPVNISQNSQQDEQPQIADGMVVWRAFNGGNWEVFSRQLRVGGSVENISSSPAYDWYPQVSDSMVVWRSNDGEDYEIVMAMKQEPKVYGTVTLRVVGDTTVEPDETFYLNLQAANPNLVVFDVARAGIDILNDDGALDFGDAPDPKYPTLLVNNGARHLIRPGFHLGALVDSEKNGQPSKDAKGDDNLTSADEDGVQFLSVLAQGSPATIKVNASAPGYLDAWMDFNADGDWDDPGEHIFDARSLATGDNTLSIDVPLGAAVGPTYARFRFSSTGGLDYDGQASDGEVEDYRVTIVSEPGLQDRVITLPGTGQNDTFEFTAGDVITVVINGAAYYFNAADVDEINFDGGLGNDVVIFHGSGDDESVELWPTRGVFQADTYKVTTVNVEVLSADSGGGDDDAVLHGSSGDDTFVGKPDLSTMTGLGVSLEAAGYPTVQAVAGTGGTDRAKLYDSANDDDTFTASPLHGEMAGTGFTVSAEGFFYVEGYADAGGQGDRALLYDSTGDDTFTGYPTVSTFTGTGFDLAATSFEVVKAYSQAGGADRATLYDSAGRDTFTAKPKSATLKANNLSYSIEASSFRYATAKSKLGGGDVAFFYDGTGEDTFEAGPSYAKLYGASFYNQADYFPVVEAYGSAGGANVAKLYDSPGNDVFTAEPNRGTMSGTGFSISATFFQYVTGYANSGGYDVATMSGSSGNDTFIGTPIYSKLSRDNGGNEYFNRVYSFDRVDAWGTLGGGGTDFDQAFLYDSAQADLLRADKPAGSSPWAELSGQQINYLYWVANFEQVTARSTSSGDKKHVTAAVDFLFTEGRWDNL